MMAVYSIQILNDSAAALPQYATFLKHVASSLHSDVTQGTRSIHLENLMSFPPVAMEPLRRPGSQ